MRNLLIAACLFVACLAVVDEAQATRPRFRRGFRGAVSFRQPVVVRVHAPVVRFRAPTFGFIAPPVQQSYYAPQQSYYAPPPIPLVTPPRAFVGFCPVTGRPIYR